MTKKSPTLEELRRAAYQAAADHRQDMRTDPEYRRAVNRIERSPKKYNPQRVSARFNGKVAGDPCSICGLSIAAQAKTEWLGGNNAQPVNAGRCCDDCNWRVVIPRRLRGEIVLPAKPVRQKPSKDE
jgi:hypothetical protein